MLRVVINNGRYPIGTSPSYDMTYNTSTTYLYSVYDIVVLWTCLWNVLRILPCSYNIRSSEYMYVLVLGVSVGYFAYTIYMHPNESIATSLFLSFVVTHTCTYAHTVHQFSIVPKSKIQIQKWTCGHILVHCTYDIRHIGWTDGRSGLLAFCILRIKGTRSNAYNYRPRVHCSRLQVPGTQRSKLRALGVSRTCTTSRVLVPKQGPTSQSLNLDDFD